MTSGHNKGPIGPLDPDMPPPSDPRLRRHHTLEAKEAVEALQSMGVPISERDLEYYHSIGEGPWHTVAPGQRTYTWGDILKWAGRTFPAPLNRKQATKYFCEELGYPIGSTVLSQLMYEKEKGPPYINLGRDTYYTKEALEKWVEQRKAAGPRHSTAPKYLPLYATRQCLSGYEGEEEPPELMLARLKVAVAIGRDVAPQPGHKGCPFVKHERCAKYPRALCNFIHLPLDPARFAAYEARGIIRLLRTKRPDASKIKAYLAAWAQRQ